MEEVHNNNLIEKENIEVSKMMVYEDRSMLRCLRQHIFPRIVFLSTK